MSASDVISTSDCPIVLNAVPPEVKVSLLTGGFDKPYVFGLASALSPKGILVDVIGNSIVASPEMHSIPGLTFRSYYWEPRRKDDLAGKIWQVLRFYVHIVLYTAVATPKIFHILWNNKVQFFDRTFLMLYYKVLGKKIVLTAHNVNAGKRDSTDSAVNRFTLKIQYHLADHIFVHTEKMKRELREDFGIPECAVTVIPFGINNSVPDTRLTRAEARKRLGISEVDRAILFFGGVRPYKGLEYLVDAFNQLERGNYRLIIAGEAKKGTESYMSDIQEAIDRAGTGGRIIQRLEYIPDEETELFFKASDVCVLPYTLVFQSGVLLLAYSFGLPVIATDVGSLSEDIIPGRTGLLCQPRDPADLAKAIREYFDSKLYKELDGRRQEIKNHANARYSWDVIGNITRNIYTVLLAGTHQ
jgi:glycosyltransferase involved in cell wall biosynthesis